MDILDRLRHQHNDLRRDMDKLERGDPGPAEIRSFGATLLGHARAEDALLFADLEGMFPGPGPVEAMREEHETIDATLAWLACHHPTDAEWPAAVRRLLQVARDHFTKEEVVLFSLAKQHLRQDRLDFLGDALAAVHQAGTRISAVP